MKRRWILSITMILIVSMLLVACGEKAPSGNNTGGNEGNSGDNANSDVFRIGLEAGYAPFNWTQMDDSHGGVKMDGIAEYAGGYDVEIAKKIAEGLGKELVIVKTDWEGLLPAVQTGVVDAIIAGMSPTAERALEIDFTDNYYKSDLVMVVRKDGDYTGAKSIQDFSAAKIAAQQGTFHDTVIDQIEGVNHDTPMGGFGELRVALESGIIDGYVSERPEGISASAANSNFLMVEFDEGFEASDDDVAIAVGLKKDSDELRDKINEILAEISEEERQEIMDKAIANQPAEED